MRINLNCPFSQKDEAKRLGARWDAARKCWYIENVEDITQFMKWIDRKEESASESDYVYLHEYLTTRYGSSPPSLSRIAAKAFGIPYPLQSGWIKRHSGSKAIRSIVFSKKVKPLKTKKTTNKIKHGSTTVGAMFSGAENRSDIPPWEDEDPPELIRLVREIGAS